MGKLFLFELRKLKKMKSLYICLAVMIALIALNAAVLAAIPEDEGIFAELFPPFAVASFTKNALANASFFLVLAVLISLYCCDDYSNCTVKNIYSKGYSRAKVYFTKYIFSAVLSLVLAAVCIIIAYAVSAGFGKQDDSTSLAAVVLCQLVMVLGYHGIYFAVSMMSGKIGISVAINFLAPMLFGIILALLTALIKVENFDLGYIWFDSVFTALNEVPAKTEDVVRAVLMGLIYAAGFVSVGFAVNRRKEV